MRRLVTLSTGEAVPISLVSRFPTQYYPDVPHCGACDTPQGPTPLRQCDAPIWHSRSRKVCGAYVCARCVQQEDGADLCPAHATDAG